jgi:hypothetical protein
LQSYNWTCAKLGTAIGDVTITVDKPSDKARTVNAVKLSFTPVVPGNLCTASLASIPSPRTSSLLLSV